MTKKTKKTAKKKETEKPKEGNHKLLPYRIILENSRIFGAGRSY